MNPFLWSGPAFLLFYAILGATVLWGCWYFTRLRGRPESVSTTELTEDPYRIACLRGGTHETVRIAVFNLVDRGLIEFDGLTLTTTRPDAYESLRRSIDRAIVTACKAPRTTEEILRDARVVALGGAYRPHLERRGLLPDDTERIARKVLAMAALAVLGVVAGIKIVAAFRSGRPFEFLVILAIAACIVTAILCHPRVTAAGRLALETLRTLIGRLERSAYRLKRGGETNEALLLAAVLGLEALPIPAFAFVKTLFPKPKGSDAGGGGGGSGDSSSCSSSCGGGGGCGGCGS